VSSASVGLATVFDDSADDVSITFSSLFRSRRLKRDGNVGKYCGDSLLGYEDDGE